MFWVWVWVMYLSIYPTLLLAWASDKRPLIPSHTSMQILEKNPERNIVREGVPASVVCTYVEFHPKHTCI